MILDLDGDLRRVMSAETAVFYRLGHFLRDKLGDLGGYSRVFQCSVDGYNSV
jgi:hypothetical protein